FSLGIPKEKKCPGVWDAFRKSCRAWTEKPPEDGKVSALCQVFADHGVPWQRAFRTGLLAALNLVLFVRLWRLFDPTGVQARGWVARLLLRRPGVDAPGLGRAAHVRCGQHAAVVSVRDGPQRPKGEELACATAG